MSFVERYFSPLLGGSLLELMLFLVAGDLLGNTEDWMAVVESSASPAQTTPTDPGGQGCKDTEGSTAAEDCTLTSVEGHGTISSRQVMELALSKLPSTGVGHLLNRGCGLNKDYDTLDALIVEVTALQTQQRYPPMHRPLNNILGLT